MKRSDCKQQTDGFSNATHKRFERSSAEARAVAGNSQSSI